MDTNSIGIIVNITTYALRNFDSVLLNTKFFGLIVGPSNIEVIIIMFAIKPIDTEITANMNIKANFTCIILLVLK